MAMVKRKIKADSEALNRANAAGRLKIVEKDNELEEINRGSVEADKVAEQQARELAEEEDIWNWFEINNT